MISLNRVERIRCFCGLGLLCVRWGKCTCSCAEGIQACNLSSVENIYLHLHEHCALAWSADYGSVCYLLMLRMSGESSGMRSARSENFDAVDCECS